MSLSFVTNFVGTGSAAIFALKSLLLGQGWSVVSSGTGSSGTGSGAYSSSGDVVTTAALMSNTNAWFVIRMPTANGVGRQLCFQHGSNNTNWRIKYAYSTGFPSGSPSASQVPSVATSSDEQVLIGSGNDASPLFLQLFATDSTYQFQACADSASPYGFWAASYATVGRAIQNTLIMDPCTGVTGDTEPYVFNVSFGNGTPLTVGSNAGAVTTNMNVESGNVLKCYMDKGLGTEGWVTVFAQTISTMVATNQVGANLFPGGAIANQWTSTDYNAPLMYGRRIGLTSPTGFKGVSRYLQWYGPQRNNGDTQGSKATIILGAVALAWDGTTTPN